MSRRIRLGLLFGGRSCEHEVSVTSARSVLAAIDGDKYDVTMIGITKEGRWLLADDATRVLEAGVVGDEKLPSVMLDYPGSRALVASPGAGVPALEQERLDVVFPLLHGPYGEDGTVQGLLELAGIPYVGSGVAGSAVGMDKELMKRAFRAENLPGVDYRVYRRSRWQREPREVAAEIGAGPGFPCFVKPVNLGSSVGVSKVRGPDELAAAMDLAASFDLKIMVEAAVVDCHEVECAVLGNEQPEASTVGEIVPGNEFYDYAAKYLDDTSELIIPARISGEAMERVRELSLRAFRAVDAAGMARVDFFVTRDPETVLVNEINTIPGFTPISMYPKLWAASGIPYPQLIDRLIELALERARERASLKPAL